VCTGTIRVESGDAAWGPAPWYPWKVMPRMCTLSTGPGACKWGAICTWSTGAGACEGGAFR